MTRRAKCAYCSSRVHPCDVGAARDILDGETNLAYDLRMSGDTGGNILDRIIETKRQEVADRQQRVTVDQLKETISTLICS